MHASMSAPCGPGGGFLLCSQLCPKYQELCQAHNGSTVWWMNEWMNEVAKGPGDAVTVIAFLTPTRVAGQRLLLSWCLTGAQTIGKCFLESHPSSNKSSVRWNKNSLSESVFLGTIQFSVKPRPKLWLLGCFRAWRSPWSSCDFLHGFL